MSPAADLCYVVLRGDLFAIAQPNLVRWLTELRALTVDRQCPSAEEFNIQSFGAVHLGVSLVFNDDDGPELEEIDHLLALPRQPKPP